ncbi:PadR family transcriptional regulator [Plantactinospora sp. CA-290183]
MSGVFGHGRLRLHLLTLLDAGPRHGYELIRVLEERFLGHYAPSAGTIYPRLRRLEVEGLVTHHAAGGRKVYQITEAGRAELRQRADEVAALESEIRTSVADLGRLAAQGRPAPGAPEPAVDPAAEFDRRLTVFLAEARRLARDPRFTEVQLRTAVRVLDGALDGFRRLLR